MSVDNPAILDAGSCTFKAGLAINFPSEEEPRVVTPAAVRHDSGAAEIRAVNNGAIVDWDAYEALVDDILYTQLGWVIGDEGAVLAGEALLASRAEREQLTQLMFEHNNVAGFLLCDQAVLSLYAVGKLSGCVVDIGHTKTDVAMVSEGQLYVPSARRLPFGMHSVSQHLQRLLRDKGVLVPDASTLSVLRNAVIRVADSAEEARELLIKGAAAPAETHTLPDGQSITVGGEGIELAEALVEGSTLGSESPSAAAAVYNACMSNPDPAARKVALESLLVCGGGSGVQGLSLRLLRELRLSLPPSASPGLIQAPEYTPTSTLQRSVWMGGAVLSKFVFQQNQHVTKFDYDEVGPTVIHKKCC